MAGQRGDRHRVVTRIRTSRRTDVGVRVDPQHCQVLAVAGGELRERGHADRALATQGDDPGRAVPADDLECGAELLDHNTLRLDSVHLLQAPVAELDLHPRRRSGVLRQDRFQHCRPHRVPAAGHIERKLRSETADAAHAGPLPLRPQQPQRGLAVPGDVVQIFWGVVILGGPIVDDQNRSSSGAEPRPPPGSEVVGRLAVCVAERDHLGGGHAVDQRASIRTAA